MIDKQLFLLLFLLVLRINSISGQSTSNELYLIPETNHFVGNVVNDICQDSLGYLWFCKEEGVFRFDGYDYTHFSSQGPLNMSLSNPITTCVTKIEANTLLIGTKNGLNCFEYNSNTINHIFLSDLIGSKLADRISCITLTQNKNVLVGTEGGLFLYNNGSKEIEEVRLPKGVESVRQIINFQHNACLLLTENSLCLFFIKSRQISKIHINELGDNFNRKVDHVFLDNTNRLWISTDSGIYISNLVPTISDFKSVEIVPISNYYPFIDSSKLTHVKTIFQDSHDDIWVSTQGSGVYCISLNDKKCKLYNKENSSLQTNYINCFFEDYNGKIYIGTEAGVNVVKQSVNRFINIDRSPYTNQAVGNLHEITIDKDNRLWVGSRGNGLNIIDQKKKKSWHFNYANNHSIDVVRTILFDSKNSVWVGSDSGVYCVDYSETQNMAEFVSRRPFEKPTLLPNEYIYCIYEDRFSNLWIGTSKGLYYYEREEGRVNKMDDSSGLGQIFNRESVYFIKRDDDGRIWFGSLAGQLLCIVDNEEEYYKGFDFKLVDNGQNEIQYFLDIEHSSDGNIWVATNVGLFQVNIQTFELFRSAEIESYKMNMFGVVEDHYQNLWISSSKGIYRYDYVRNRIEHYSIDDGLPLMEFNGGTSLKDMEGNVYFGSRRGILKIVPKADLKDMKKVNNLHISDLKVNGTSVSPNLYPNILDKHISVARQIYLQSDQRNISFDFSSFNHYVSANTIFQCKIEGVDTDWNNLVNTNSITYANLPAGDLVFLYRVKGGLDYEKLKIRVDNFWYLRWWFFATFFLLVCLLGWYIHQVKINKLDLDQKLKVTQIEHEESEKLYEAKLSFFTNVSHEIRTPLSLVMAPLRSLLQDQTIQETTKYRANLAMRNANRLNLIVDEILDFRRLDKNKLKLNVSENEIKNDIKTIVSDFESFAKETGVSLEFCNRLDKTEAIVYDRGLISKAVINLIANAIKASYPDQRVTIVLSNEPYNGKYENTTSIIERKDLKRYLFVTVQDEGIGIKKNDLELIFNRFYTSVNSKSGGTGLGLFLVKNFILLHDGVLSIHSEQGKGTAICFGLPIDCSSLKGNYKTITHEFDNANHVILASNGEEKNIRYENVSSTIKILIVEDNEELRQFLAKELSIYFNVSTAVNSEDGITKINQLYPDLVVSDVMMGEMSGYDLCSLVKSNAEFCHIPIILLTAKTTEEDQIIGYNAGADDYVKKPFSVQVLKAKIESLILNRNKVIEKFRSNDLLSINSLEVPDLDKELVRTIQKIISKNMENSNFSMEAISSDLGFSRAGFYRKVKSLTGQTPNVLLRNFRLNVALKLLKEHDLSISEVAYKTGFNDPKYFTKCFKKEYHMLPSEVNRKEFIS